MKYYRFYSLLILLINCLLFSCIKDTDFDQSEDVVITPEVELDLVFFNLVAEDFFDQVAQTPRLMVSDTTRLNFFESSEIQESLRRVDFQFNFTNTIARQFNVDFEFLNLNNTITYRTGAVVEPSTNGEEVITVFEETVENQELLDLLRSRQVVISVTIPEANAVLSGTLNLKSKTTYFLEIE